MNQTVEKRLDGASVGDWIRNNTNLLLMFALIIVGALTSDNFFSMDNILNVLRRITVNGMLAVACTMTLLVGGFDLSIGHVMALSAVLCIGFEVVNVFRNTLKEKQRRRAGCFFSLYFLFVIVDHHAPFVNQKS